MMMTTTMRRAVITLLMLVMGLMVHCGAPSSMAVHPDHKAVGEITRPEKAPDPATYWVTFPTRVHAGMRLAVRVQLLTANHTAIVEVSLTGRFYPSFTPVVLTQTSLMFVSGRAASSTIYLEIPNTLERRAGYAIRVVAKGDINFTQSEAVFLNEMAFSVFVQTDKGIYKPGQTVKIRALAMNSDRTVLKEPMDIFIKDPEGNGIKRWRQVRGREHTGVVEKSLPTSTDPPLGQWEIHVTVREVTEIKKFTIDKYVLPTFEVRLDMSDVHVISEVGLKGKAVGSYTWGKPLSGAAVTVTAKYQVSDYTPHDFQPPPSNLTRSGVLDKQGQFAFFFPEPNLPSRHLHYLQGVKVIAEVTDIRSGRKLNVSSDVRFLTLAAKLEFLPLTPKVYKPLFPYTAYLKVTRADGTLFPVHHGTLFPVHQRVTVRFYVYMRVWDPPPDPAPNASYHAVFDFMDRPLMLKTEPLTDTGLLSVTLDSVMDNGGKLFVEATVLGVSNTVQADRAASNSNNYLQVTRVGHTPQVGKVAEIRVKTTEAVRKLNFQVYAKSVMVSEFQVIHEATGPHPVDMSFPVTANMAPICKVLVFYIRADGEVVADTLILRVDDSETVSVRYSGVKVRPGSHVNLTISAPPYSAVFLLAVNKNVLLLNPGNDITHDMVSEELSRQDSVMDYHAYWRDLALSGWPSSSPGVDSYSVFKNAGVAMVTDGYLYRKRQIHYNTTRYRRGAVAELSVGPPPPSQTGPQRVRSFSDTWLWDLVIIGPSGQADMKVRVPDSITTWLTSAFAVLPELFVMRQPVELTTFKDVFLILDLPYSAIRGEDMCMKAQAFNFYNKSVQMTVTMEATAGIDNIRVPHTGLYRRSERVDRVLGEVGRDEVGEALFCFTPRSLGQLPIRVNLTGDNASSDAVERMLLVEAEGTPRVTNIPMILDVKPGEVFERQVPIHFPAGTVRDTLRITVSVAGYVLGLVFDNIDDLLRMPYGSGEQNMLYFAPNVFLIDYLQKTNTYTPQRAEKAEKYMQNGYQNEIRYQHADWSFSAFGNRYSQEPGSMWLTAFVVKCFSQSLALEGDVVSMEPILLHRAISWIISRQQPDGAFPEPGKVFDKKMQGESAKGETLTAYVLIALAEANRNFTRLDQNKMAELQDSLTRGRSFLDQQFRSLNNTYDLAIVTYALHLTNSSECDVAFHLLTSKGINKNPVLHRQPRYPWQRGADAITIEMMSYAALTYMARDDVEGAVLIVRWLIKQRGPLGGFVSTQDTVVGLQALSAVSTQLFRSHTPAMAVSVMWEGGGNVQHSASVALNDSTAGLLHTVHVPIENGVTPSNITIRASSPHHGNVSGFAIAEVRLSYNIFEDAKFLTFRLSPEVQHVNDKLFLLKVTARRTDGQTGNMTVMEVQLLTGYDVDEDHPQYNRATARAAELKGRHYVLYFDQMGGNPVTLTLPMKVTSGLMLHPESAVIHIYDDNAGDQQQEVRYTLSERSICNVHPTYESCANVTTTLTG